MKLTVDELFFLKVCLEKCATAEKLDDALTWEERQRVVAILNKRQAEEVLPRCVYGEG